MPKCPMPLAGLLLALALAGCGLGPARTDAAPPRGTALPPPGLDATARR